LSREILPVESLALAEPGFARALPMLLTAIAPTNVVCLTTGDAVQARELELRRIALKMQSRICLSDFIVPETITPLTRHMLILQHAGEGAFKRVWSPTINDWFKQLQLHSPPIPGDDKGHWVPAGVLTFLISSSNGASLDTVIAELQGSVSLAKVAVLPCVSQIWRAREYVPAATTSVARDPPLPRDRKFVSKYVASATDWPSTMCACIRYVLVTLIFEHSIATVLPDANDSDHAASFPWPAIASIRSARTP
jgi:hypothetical protein